MKLPRTATQDPNNPTSTRYYNMRTNEIPRNVFFLICKYLVKLTMYMMALAKDLTKDAPVVALKLYS